MPAKTIDSTSLRNNLSETIELVSNGEPLLVSKHGQLKAALISVDDLEDLLEARDPTYAASIRKAREQYKNGEIYSFDEVFGGL